MSKIKEFYKQGEVLSSSETAVLLGISKKTLRRWASCGKVPFLKVNRTEGFILNEVIEAVEVHKGAL